MALPRHLIQPMLDMFEQVLLKSAIDTRKRWKDAQENAGTSFMDAVKEAQKKTGEHYDKQVSDWQDEIEALRAKSASLRESQTARLVETGKMTSAGASVDRLKREATESRVSLRLQLDAFNPEKGGILDSETFAGLAAKAEEVLGKTRGPKSQASSGDSEPDSEPDSDEQTGDSTPDAYVTEV